jgi:hypothetical protein
VAAAVVGYAAIRFGVVPRTEAWSLVGADADGAMLWTTLSVSNTGLLDGQLTTGVLLLPPGPDLLEHRAMWGPTTLGDDGVRSGPDALVAVPGGWELRVGGDGLGARVQARGAVAGCPPEVGRMTGFIEDRIDGRVLSGPAVVVRTAVAGHAEGAALYVLGQGFAAGIEPTSDCPAWVRTATETWTGAASAFPVARGTTLTLGAWTLTFRASGGAMEQDGWAHLLLGERWVARAFGFLPPLTDVRRAVVRVDGPGAGLLAPALVVERR